MRAQKDARRLAALLPGSGGGGPGARGGKGKRKKGTAPLPVKMEICSGTGEWAVAQARADAGRADWVAMELRPDLVYQTLVSMALEVRAAACARAARRDGVLTRGRCGVGPFVIHYKKKRVY